MKLKSAEVKEKLVEYITNPNTSSNNDIDRHVSSSDKLGKPYRNLTPIFSIDDDHEPNGDYYWFVIQVRRVVGERTFLDSNLYGL